MKIVVGEEKFWGGPERGSGEEGSVGAGLNTTHTTHTTHTHNTHNGLAKNGLAKIGHDRKVGAPNFAFLGVFSLKKVVFLKAGM